MPFLTAVEKSSTEILRAHIFEGSALMRIADLVPKPDPGNAWQDADPLADLRAAVIIELAGVTESLVRAMYIIG